MRPGSAESSGPVVGTTIIIALLLIGALYFAGIEQRSRSANHELPLIPSADMTAQPVAR